MNLKIYTDGGARGNPGPAATGYLIKNEQFKLIKKAARYIGKTTNNIAEYQAVIDALNALIDLFKLAKISEAQDMVGIIDIKNVNRIDVYIDSQLVVNQLNGLYKVRQDNLRTKILDVRKLENKLPAIYYYQIPRGQNKEADFLVNKALNEQKQ